MIIELQQKVIELMKQLIELLKKKTTDGLPVAIEIAKQEDIDIPEYLATIHAESGWNSKAIGKNKNGTTDYGICQINDYGGIGKTSRAALVGDYYFPSVQFVIDNPEECLRWMAKQFKKGRQNDGCAYSSGSYKKYIGLYKVI